MSKELLQYRHSRFDRRMRILNWILLVTAGSLFILTILLAPSGDQKLLALIATGVPTFSGLIGVLVPRGRALTLIIKINIGIGLLAMTGSELSAPHLVGTGWPMFLVMPLIGVVVLPRIRDIWVTTALSFLGLISIPLLRFTQIIPTTYATNFEVLSRDWVIMMISFVLITSAVLVMGINERRTSARTFARLRQQDESNQVLNTTLRATQQTNQDIRQLISAQSGLQTLVDELSAPIITISDTQALLPLNGPLDEEFLLRLDRELPQHVHAHGFKQLVFDLTGTTLLDGEGVRRLHALVRKLELLGCQTFISGITRTMAPIIAQVDDDLLTERVVHLHTVLQRWMAQAA